MDLKRSLLLIGAGCIALTMFGCKPSYPKCKTDDHCQSSKEAQEEGKLYCVNGLCQQCSEDADCGDASLECNAGVCDKIPGYCASVSDCPGNQKCRDGRCGPECAADDECGDGQKCEGGNCVAGAECTSNADCADGMACQGGQCVAVSSECSLEPVHFGYDSSNLDDSSRQQLQANADCIKSRGLTVTLEGHSDERGTSEYNLALGERRAAGAYKYLRQLGIAQEDMTTITYGEERLLRECGESGPESCHRANRRVQFVVK